MRIWCASWTQRGARRWEGSRIVHGYRAAGGMARIGEPLERSLRRVTPSDVKLQQGRQHSSRHVLGKLFESRLDALHEYAGGLEPRHALQTAEKVQPERRVHLVRVDGYHIYRTITLAITGPRTTPPPPRD